jgi:hypothetical protein
MDQSISIARDALANPPAELADVVQGAPHLVQQAQSTLDSPSSLKHNGDKAERQDNARGEGLDAKLQVGEWLRSQQEHDGGSRRWGRERNSDDGTKQQGAS